MPTFLNDPARERYLDYEARCRQAFTPFAPIELPDFFAGRREIVERVDGELRAPGRHVAIFGERGVGKTSLATLLYFFTPFEPSKVHIVRCTADDSFDSVIGQFLAYFGRDLELDSVERVGRKGAKLRVGAVEAEGASEQRQVFRRVAEARSLSPARLLEAFSPTEALLIVDEYDRIQEEATHRRFAELIKAFSDARSKSKIVIVGVAGTLAQLIGKHESLSRSLAQIRLDRMGFAELAEIVRRGAQRTEIRFSDWVTERIARLADGFPQYVHLIALYSSLEAIRVLLERPEERRIAVGEAEYQRGLERAIAATEHSLADAYETATVTTRKKSEIYEVILKAMALSAEPVVQVRELATKASELAGEEVKPSRLSTPLSNLTKDRGQVLTKVRDGYYRFTNPLLKAYVRLLLEHRYGTQLELPFYRVRETPW